jgi:hypothetical protein
MQKMEKIAVSLIEAARALSIRESDVHYLVRHGLIEARLVDDRMIIPVEGLRRFVNAEYAVVVETLKSVLEFFETYGNPSTDAPGIARDCFVNARRVRALVDKIERRA